MIPNIVFILVSIALCILGCSLLSRIKAWACEMENLINVLKNYLEKRD